MNRRTFIGTSIAATLAAAAKPAWAADSAHHIDSIGVQVIGHPFEDELVLAVAEAIERARGPWQAPPL